jgi:beta-lactamase regulating signal transducer with metallopeptidase domain
LLSNETFHKFNRAALLGILFLSMTLPLIEISTMEQQPEISENLMLMLQSAFDYSNAASIELMQQPETATVTWLHAILLIYIAGVIFFPIRNIYSVIKLCLLVKNGRKQTIENNITLIVHSNHIAPFSWFKYIVISEKDFNENGNEIIIHEKAHILKRHSIDLLICHIYSIIQWINPVVWLFKRELQNIHEYEADEAVIKKGVNTKQYQMLLIQKAVGAKLFALANNFNKCKLKKRIKMMSKNKSNPYSRLKYLYVLPALAIVVTAFANPHVKNEMEKISSVSVSDFMSQNEINRNERTNADDSITVTVFNQAENNDSIAASTISFITITNGNSNDTVFINDRENEKKSNLDALIIVDEKEIIDNIGDIDENEIEKISVIKNGATFGKDGDKKNGVILITTKTGKGKTTTQSYTLPQNSSGYAYMVSNNDCDSISENEHFYYIKSKKNASDSIAKKNKRMFKNIYIEKYQNLDSLQFQSLGFNYWNDSLTTWDFDMKKINTDSLKVLFDMKKINADSLKVLFDMKKLKFNPDSLFTFPKIHYNADSLKKMNFNFHFDYDSDEYDLWDMHPLVIVDGKEMTFNEFSKIDTQIIGSINVLKDKQAIEKYGAKARNGVIIIETKNIKTKK